MAQTLYTAIQTGSDSNAGTLDFPFKTMGFGISRMGAGDTLFVGPGNYNEGFGSMPSGTSWLNKVRIAAYLGAAVWLKPLVHQAGNPGACLRFQGNESYIEFDGINMDGRTMGYDTVVFISNVGIGEPHHIRIQNAQILASNDNSAYNSLGAMAIEIHGGKPVMIGGHEFRYLTISGGGKAGTGSFANNGYGIYLAGPNNLVEYCDIYNNKGAGIQIFNDDGASPDNNIVRNTRIHDQTRNSDISQLWGIICIGNNNQLYNNLIYRINSEVGTATFGQGIACAGDGNYILNNTITKCTLQGITLGAGSGNVVKNNISWNNGSAYNDGASGTDQTNNLFGVNPLFVNEAADDFRLKDNSPAIDAGIAV